MQNWTGETWQILTIGIIIGIIIGYVITRFGNANVKKQAETLKKLEDANQQLTQQQERLQQHFSESAELMKNLAQNYQALYQHFGQSSLELLPNQEKSCFSEFPYIQEKTTSNTSNTTEHSDTGDEQEQNPPRDYSEGSSGLLKSHK